jgi:5-formyltetrahydrofolate cyclo-ligase
MSVPGSDAKSALREQIRTRLRLLPAAERALASAQLCRRFEQEPRFVGARNLLLFAPLKDEPDVWPLVIAALKAGHSVALPRFDASTQSYHAAHITHLDQDLVAGAFGVREPARHCPEEDLNRLDLVLVPGVAFDARGWRVGRGRGFYDRLLTRVRGTTCGAAFDEQIVEALPVEAHDVRLNCILTPTRLIET